MGLRGYRNESLCSGESAVICSWSNLDQECCNTGLRLLKIRQLNPNSQTPSKHAFPNTRWSLVLAAAQDAQPSLEALCQRYWHPVYAVARRAGNDVEAAQDLTQGFFAKLLEKGWLEAADQEKGRFRTFLVTALKRYMANEWHRDHAAKRGGYETVFSLDTDFAERLDTSQSARELSPDQLFDKRWALALLEQAMVRLKEEHVGEHFELLKESLTAGRGEVIGEAELNALNLAQEKYSKRIAGDHDDDYS